MHLYIYTTYYKVSKAISGGKKCNVISGFYCTYYLIILCLDFIFLISVCEPRSNVQRRRAANESGRPPAARTEGRAGAEGLEGDIHGQGRRRQLRRTIYRQGMKLVDTENFGYSDTNGDWQKCHYNPLSQYPMIFSVRRSFLGLRNLAL